MGEIRKIKPVKLIIGIFAGRLEMIEAVRDKLKRKFGKIDFESSLLSFSHTDYYREEMGDELKRKLYSFERLIYPERLPQIKLFTNKLEKKSSLNTGKRRINIDPGYLSLAKFVLATTKDYSHRLYLKQGIFAEVSLSFKEKSFGSFPWTYPDYCQKEYIEIFNQIRKIYKDRLKG